MGDPWNSGILHLRVEECTGGNSLHLLDLKYWLQGPWKIFSVLQILLPFVRMMTSNELMTFFLVPGTFQPLTPHQFYWRLKPKLILENTWMHLSKPMINGFLKIDVGSSALLRDCLVWCIQKVHSRVASLSKYRADTLSEIAILIVFMHFRFGHEKDRKYSFSAENSLRVDLLTQKY